MRRTRSHQHLPGATDATSADFPVSAFCLQAQSIGEERGSRDSPAFRRHLLPVRLLLVRHLLRVKRFASSSAAVPSAVRRLPSPGCACCFVCVLVGVGVIGIRAAQAAPPSGTHAAGCDLAGHQVIVSALAGLCFALACVDHVLSWCAFLMCRSCVCLPSGLRIDRLSC